MTNPATLPRKVVVLALLLVALVAAGCGARATDTDASPIETPAELNFVDDDPEDRLPVPTLIKADQDAAPAFDFVTTELETGSEVSGSYLFDQAPMIMTFVTPTCPVCVAESYELILAADTNPDITYVMVHSGADREAYVDFMDNADLYRENIINLDDTAGDLLLRFRILSQPSSILVFPSGEIRSSTGALDAHGLERAAELLREA